MIHITHLRTLKDRILANLYIPFILFMCSCQINEVELNESEETTSLRIHLVEEANINVEQNDRVSSDGEIDYYLVNFFDIGKQIPVVYYGIFDELITDLTLEVPKNALLRIQVVGLSKGNTFGLYSSGDSVYFKKLHPITNSMQEGDYWVDQSVNLALNDLKYFISADSTATAISRIKASPAKVFYGITDITTNDEDEQITELLLYRQGFQVSAKVTNIGDKKVIMYIDGNATEVNNTMTEFLKEYSFSTNVSVSSSQINSVEVRIEVVENIDNTMTTTEIYNERLIFTRMERKHFEIQLPSTTSSAVFPISVVEEPFFLGDTVTISQ